LGVLAVFPHLSVKSGTARFAGGASVIEQVFNGTPFIVKRLARFHYATSKA
jgi:hypothetical protein